MKKIAVTVLVVNKPTITGRIYPKKVIEDWITKNIDNSNGDKFFMGVIDKVLTGFNTVPVNEWVGIATNPRLEENNLVVDITPVKKIDFKNSRFFTLGVGNMTVDYNSKQEIVCDFDLESIVVEPNNK
jgi:hypothetical protein